MGEAEQRLAAAQQAVQRLEAERQDYKARAHVLLKAKEKELRTVKDVVRCERPRSRPAPLLLAGV